MLPPSSAGALLADVNPIVYWLVFNHKIIGLFSGLWPVS